MSEQFFGKNGFIWWIGVVESRKDPLFLGRCKVRMIGWDRDNKQDQPTDDLPWTYPIIPLDNGKNPIGPKEGDWVVGFFRDGEEGQEPVMMGILPGIPEKESIPDKGFNDPTPDAELTVEKQPRPPEFSPVSEGEDGESESEESLGKYSNPDKIPVENTAFGELSKDFDPAHYKFDLNADGKYDQVDANLIVDPDGDGSVGAGENEGEFFDGGASEITYPMSRYPLKPFLNEPTTSRLARAEKIEETIIAKKRGDVTTGETADHAGSGVGTDVPVGSEPMTEPETPYAAIYPYNHVYESESGNVTEIDDTPQAERMHWYHRSGTFEEIHPDGVTVDKTVKSKYQIVYEDFFTFARKKISITAGESVQVKSGSEATFNIGASWNRDVGTDLNTLVGKNVNTKVGENAYIVVKGDVRILVEGNVFVASEGDMMFKAKGDFLVDAKNIKTQASEQNIVAGQEVLTQGTITYFQTAITAGDFVIAQKSFEAGIASTISPVIVPPVPPPVAFEKDNTADNKDNVVTSASSPKQGFLFQEGTSGDLYKPVSDSTGLAVTLSPTLGTPHILYEAIPTGELETVQIQYKHLDNSITTWEVVRPVHKKGRMIERGTFAGNGNGGRDHYRFSKSGSEYPSEMVLNIGSTDYLLVDSSQRHEKL